MSDEDNLKCEDCGKYEAYETTCPFVMEMYEQEVTVTLCEECREERRRSV
jgi:hypothetical protein